MKRQTEVRRTFVFTRVDRRSAAAIMKPFAHLLQNALFVQVGAMRIELANLEGTDGRFAHKYEPGELVPSDDRVRLSEPPAISGRVLKANSKVKLEGRITARAQVECDRCLKLIDVPVDTDFPVEYVTTEEYVASDVAELAEEDMQLSVFDGEVIDIDELVNEQLLLAVPTRVVCEESCKGFCPVCGANRNAADCSCEVNDTDPRWAGLKDLRF
jgi:uncharacterized protein